MPGRKSHFKAGRRMSPPPLHGKVGRPRTTSPAKGKSVSPAVAQTRAARAAALWGSTAMRWRNQLSTTAGEIISFAARGVLLLVILCTMELPFIKPLLRFGHATARPGVKVIGAALALVQTMTNVSVNAPRGLWKSTSESEEDGTVYIEQPQHYRHADPNLDKKNLRRITTPHLRAIDAHIE